MRGLLFSIKCCVVVGLTLLSTQAIAGNKIKYFFNQPVDTTVATGVKAVYLNNCIADTLAAYLGRAKYSLDICVYDFDKTLSFSSTVLDTVFAPKIANAINSAFARGVQVRWIYEGSNGNSGLDLIDTGIHTLASPQGSNYTIMHNKFVVIDGGSSNPDDAIVWTGCLNWYVQQFNWDYNNVVVVQDSALAHAYVAEFNMMWGGTGLSPNLAASKFGRYKTDLGRHNFTIEGNNVELYFSPSDATNSHIQAAINSANTDLYFGMYTFTDNSDANLIMTKFNSGVYVAGLDDSWSNSYTPHTTFTAGLGANFKVYTETSSSIYHNKFLIVDPSNTCSDPLVLTGSHNWSTSANTKNDENTLIIHNDTAANLYYQYFKASFNALGGVLAAQHGCNAGIEKLDAQNGLSIFPNPSDGAISISYNLLETQPVTLEIYSIDGRLIANPLNNIVQATGIHNLDCSIHMPGIFIAKFISASGNTTTRFIVNGK